MAIDPVVFDAASRNACSVVIRPTTICGEGRGEIIRSNVRIDDVVELYVLALAKAPGGALDYSQSSETALKDKAVAIGFKAHSLFGSNSRVRGKRSRAELGLQLDGVSTPQDVEHGWYRRVHRV